MDRSYSKVWDGALRSYHKATVWGWWQKETTIEFWTWLCVANFRLKFGCNATLTGGYGDTRKVANRLALKNAIKDGSIGIMKLRSTFYYRGGVYGASKKSSNVKSPQNTSMWLGEFLTVLKIGWQLPLTFLCPLLDVQSTAVSSYFWCRAHLLHWCLPQ